MLEELMPIMIENFKICVIENAPALAKIAGCFAGAFVFRLTYMFISKKIYEMSRQP